MPRHIPEGFLTLQQAADEFGVARESVRYWIATGRCPGYRRGPQLFVKRDEVLESLTPVPVEPWGAR